MYDLRKRTVRETSSASQEDAADFDTIFDVHAPTGLRSLAYISAKSSGTRISGL